MDQNRKTTRLGNSRNSPTEIPTITPESSFQLEHNNSKRQSVILQDAHKP